MFYDKWWKNHNHDLEDEDQALLAGCPRKSQTIDQVKFLRTENEHFKPQSFILFFI
jgi:hypothetical protein